MKTRVLCILALFFAVSLSAQTRQVELFNDGWTFHLGNASGMQAGFGHGPADPAFDDSGWRQVTLPHDWVVDLPFDGSASHGHGYKCVGWKYPENSTGWYRKRFSVEAWEKGRHFEIRFDGVLRDSEVYCNGFYLGHERGGYASSVYDITPYLNCGGENVIAVRVDASKEEVRSYEGAGIYRDVYLVKTSSVFIPQFSTRVSTHFGVVNVRTRVANKNILWDEPTSFTVMMRILNEEGSVVSRSDPYVFQSRPFETVGVERELHISIPHLWDLDDRYMYRLVTEVYRGSDLVDEETVRFGVRDVEFSPSRGLVLNNRKVVLHGVNLHQDHAGVGAAVPRELWRYRLTRLQELGVNAIRCASNPASPALLELCDEMGMMVIEENSQPGINDGHLDLLRRLIERDYNHPSVILWGLGGGERQMESDPRGYDLVKSMSEYAHRVDPTRSTIYANGGGKASLGASDVNGYNYIRRNDPVGDHATHPKWVALGTEESTGAGTRGIYVTDPEKGWMKPLNRSDNLIESGLRFYEGKEWTAGVFFQAGFDHRGESGTMAWPATGSQYGILDYCGYPKDEAYYLKSWWTWQPVLFVTPAADGEIWVYTNCESVELTVDNKRLGRKFRSEYGHLVWTTDKASPKKIVAKGVYQGRPYSPKVNVSYTWPETLKATTLTPSRNVLWADGQDVVIIDIMSDRAELDLSVQGPADILGWGNGDPGFRETERPLPGEPKDHMRIKPFGRRAQVILRGRKGETGKVVVSADGKSITLDCF